MSLEKKARELDKDQIFFYKEMGYLVVPGVFSHDECDVILSRIRHFANRDFAALMNPDRPEYLLAQYTKCRFGIQPNDESPKIGPIVDKIEGILQYPDRNQQAEALELKREQLDNVYETSSFLRDVMRDPRQRDILETLQGREIAALMSQVLFKEAGTRFAKEQGWKPHQDNSYPKNPDGQYITTNLFLADANKENGTLYIYPGSHKLGLLPSEETQSFREAKGSAPGNRTIMPGIWEDAHYDVNFKKGDLLVLNGNTIHGSYPNLSNRSRPLYSQSLISKGEPFVPGPNARRIEISLR